MDPALTNLHHTSRCIGEQFTVHADVNPIHLNHRNRAISCQGIQCFDPPEPQRARQRIPLECRQFRSPGLEHIKRSLAETQRSRGAQIQLGNIDESCTCAEMNTAW